jgi:hypothetical protein
MHQLSAVGCRAGAVVCFPRHWRGAALCVVVDVDAWGGCGLENTLFGLTEEQIAYFGLTVGIAALVIYMVFIVFKLAKESRAGRFGTFILFLVLMLGVFAFLAKAVVQWFLES